MKTIRLTGFVAGMQKIPLTRHLQAHFNLGLAAAKSITDAVLDGKTYELQVLDVEAPSEADALRAFGVVVELSAAAQAA